MLSGVIIYKLSKFEIIFTETIKFEEKETLLVYLQY